MSTSGQFIEQIRADLLRAIEDELERVGERPTDWEALRAAGPSGEVEDDDADARTAQLAHVLLDHGGVAAGVPAREGEGRGRARRARGGENDGKELSAIFAPSPFCSSGIAATTATVDSCSCR